MANPYEQLCKRCGKRPVEVIDDWASAQCSTCNDRDIERNQEREEWNYYHPPLKDGEC
jgi:hypothetical protein